MLSPLTRSSRRLIRGCVVLLCIQSVASWVMAQSPTNLASESVSDRVDAMKFAPMPEALTSFGAARLGDALYVYGGHTGSAHAYWDKSQSGALLRLDLSKKDQAWEQVSEGPRLQGLALVPYDGKVIRVGGFYATNAKGEPQDLRSSDAVAAFDPVSGKWTDYPKLPEPRSSHDAVVVGSTLYVVGGWDLNGGKDSKWHTTAWSFDLSNPSAAWTELSKPDFKRRALALVGHGGRLYAIGGMNEDGGPTRDTAVYDLSKSAWTKGPTLQGTQGMVGFGAAAISDGKSLYVSTYDGALQRLSADGSVWESIGKTEDARFFHRLVRLDDKHLLSIGGANMESGKFRDPEVVNLSK